MPDGDPAVTRPHLTYDDVTWRLAALTHDGLVGFRRAGGVQGAGLVPDLATTLPDPTDGGLTYTFHLRKGVRYSTGAPVLAGDIRRGIERTVVHSTCAGTATTRRRSWAAQACRNAADKAVAAEQAAAGLRPAARASSPTTQTGTVTFHLTEADPEFLYQLALPNAAAVPAGHAPLDLPPGTFLPATGPYMIDSYTREAGSRRSPGPHGRLELVRNPHFREWSTRRAARRLPRPDRPRDRLHRGGKPSRR